ncbi:13059_t:CDS:2 [Acaulospora colombiana]|uniref:13059_t:CDS:1 n=1 Tax=Acaulospora colombiana TaxID=27376 RepID=A0ACA9LG55_9GLOM|nr:13059_t:CDS:2 [Acaulospora colombiana]
MGLGNDDYGEERMINNSNRNYNRKKVDTPENVDLYKGYDNEKGESDETQEDDEEENVPLGVILGKKHLGTINYD